MSAPMDDEDLPEPPQVRRLRLLVTVLTVVSILGVVAVVALLVIRLLMVPTPTAPAAGVSRVSADVAERLVLPAGERIVAVGAAGPVLLIATEDAAGQERLRRFDASSGAALGVTLVERE